ncbi:MAG: Mur ligase family protein [Bacteroidota bacterium]|nr:Mur ligase family protein [Bacteroidota bacterium]
MKIHLIAIGGSAMHNLALALHEKGYQVTGSDDEIFEPSRSRLEKKGLLPQTLGWDANRITPDLDAIILGMHAREDNPELIKARQLGLKIFSYPEYLYEQTKNKKRVVIAGSHGKTSITSMIMHVLKHTGRDFDYMVGALVEGFDTMVRLSESAPVAIFEGDEYLSSPIDLRPKFHLYKPHIALISGIAWDHINVFPTFEIYKQQFSTFISLIEPNGTLYYYEGDSELRDVVLHSGTHIDKEPYKEHESIIRDNETYLTARSGVFKLTVFGKHNLQNINGAKLICNQLGVSDIEFYNAICTFKGAAKRLQVLHSAPGAIAYLDFAHAPSKVKATISALKEQFPTRKLIACLELHTFSSLNAEFLDQYRDSMQVADEAIVYFNPETLRHKRLPEISEEQVKKAFGKENLKVFIDTDSLVNSLKSISYKETNLLLMSSGNFAGIDLKGLSLELF